MSTTITFETNVYDAAKGPNPVRTIRKDFDVNDWEAFSQAELAVVRWGKEAEALALGEAVKKKKRLWLPHLWRRMRSWLRTEGG